MSGGRKSESGRGKGGGERGRGSEKLKEGGRRGGGERNGPPWRGEGGDGTRRGEERLRKKRATLEGGEVFVLE